MNARTIPVDGVNPYANHPGFEQTECEDRHTITRRNPYGTAMSGGFGCLRTGGHCVGHQCPRGRFDASGNPQPDTIEVDRPIVWNSTTLSQDDLIAMARATKPRSRR